jgi:mannose/fructose/N-acetylgalactosamine-specific phosphotransferase system component IIC
VPFDLAKSARILEQIKTPLTLAGLALLIFYGVLRQVLSLKIWSALQEKNTAALLRRVLTYVFVLALVCAVLGVASFVAVEFMKPAAH